MWLDKDKASQNMFIWTFDQPHGQYHALNIGTQGVQELFFVNNKSLEVVNNACQSMVLPVRSFKSGQ